MHGPILSGSLSVTLKTSTSTGKFRRIDFCINETLEMWISMNL